MNSEFDSKQLDEIITNALDTSIAPIDRSYGQLGFMESQVIESIFTAFQDRIGQTDLINIIKESRIPAISVQNNFKITDLHTVTHNCKKCQSYLSVNPQLPKWNVTNPDVVFIMDSPSLNQQASALFISALKSAGFSSDKVCLTYLVRCPVNSNIVDQTIVDNCSNYLHQEIQLMNPKLVVPVGNNALKVFFGADATIKTYKGKITWLGSWPIFPVYSLLYILKAGANVEESFQSDMLQAYQFCYSKGS
jgi:uracil-DNA glycosylase family 4